MWLNGLLTGFLELNIVSSNVLSNVSIYLTTNTHKKSIYFQFAFSTADTDLRYHVMKNVYSYEKYSQLQNNWILLCMRFQYDSRRLSEGGELAIWTVNELGLCECCI